jgi:hypothetical protein
MIHSVFSGMLGIRSNALLRLSLLLMFAVGCLQINFHPLYTESMLKGSAYGLILWRIAWA